MVRASMLHVPCTAECFCCYFARNSGRLLRCTVQSKALLHVASFFAPCCVGLHSLHLCLRASPSYVGHHFRSLYNQGLITEKTVLVGYARSKLSREDLANKLRPFLQAKVSTPATLSTSKMLYQTWACLGPRLIKTVTDQGGGDCRRAVHLDLVARCGKEHIDGPKHSSYKCFVSIMVSLHSAPAAPTVFVSARHDMQANTFEHSTLLWQMANPVKTHTLLTGAAVSRCPAMLQLTPGEEDKCETFLSQCQYFPGAYDEPVMCALQHLASLALAFLLNCLSKRGRPSVGV